jgi:heme/copper-type cytochrome/quinol oxidase subunit 3
MQSLAVKECMLTDALTPPLDKPQLPAVMTTEQLRSSGKLASWTHQVTAQQDEQATELLLTVAMILGNDLHCCEVAAQMSCAHFPVAYAQASHAQGLHGIYNCSLIAHVLVIV